ncbi:MAG: hypothetical protein AAFX06_04635 [Planctomycetota bacterium]
MNDEIIIDTTNLPPKEQRERAPASVGRKLFAVLAACAAVTLVFGIGWSFGHSQAATESNEERDLLKNLAIDWMQSEGIGEPETTHFLFQTFDHRTHFVAMEGLIRITASENPRIGRFWIECIHQDGRWTPRVVQVTMAPESDSINWP